MTRKRQPYITNNIILELKPQVVYPIQESDWGRIKSLVNKITPHRRIIENLAYVCFGVSGSSLASIVALQTATNVASWVTFLTIGLIIVPLMLGLIFLYFDRQQTQQINVSVKDLLDEIALLENCFANPTEEQNSIIVK